MQLAIADAAIYFFENVSFFTRQKLKKPPSNVAQKYSNLLFSLTAWAAQTAQTDKFMFQNVTYKPAVYRTGIKSGIKHKFV